MLFFRKKFNNRRFKFLFLAVVGVLFALTMSVMFKARENNIQSLINFDVRPKPYFIANDLISGNEKLKIVTVQSGDNISTILGRLHIESFDIYSAIKTLSKKFSPSKLKKGDKIYVYYNSRVVGDSTIFALSRIKIVASDTEHYELYRNSKNDFSIKKLDSELYVRLKVVSARIKSSLYNDAIEAKVPASIIMEFIRLYSFDLDFQRDIRNNDKFKIFYEAYYNGEGEFVKNGNIIYCQFYSVRNEKEIVHYRYTTTKGSTLYFNENGSSVKKSLLKTPISGARVSSRFGYRKHPVLGYNKLHSGIDFAARRGTPIIAAGKGTIKEIGWKGSYGKFIMIRHNSKYSTAYAHMTRFKRGLRRGSQVKQGQVIGYVGSTGRSTGPHLHYEVRKYGRAINPKRVKPQAQVRLYGKELDKFKKHRARVDFIMNNAFAELKY